MISYPVFLNLASKKCIVVGGGPVGERKSLALIEAGALLTIISPTLTAPLHNLKASQRFTHLDRHYRTGDLTGAFLVVAATSDRVLNQQIANESPALANVVDAPHLCNFFVPSQMRQGDLHCAISTSGISPALAKTIRQELEHLYGGEFAGYLEFLKNYRDKVLSSTLNSKDRKTLLAQAGSKEALNALRTQQSPLFMKQMNLALEEKLKRQEGDTHGPTQPL